MILWEHLHIKPLTTLPGTKYTVSNYCLILYVVFNNTLQETLKVLLDKGGNHEQCDALVRVHL